MKIVFLEKKTLGDDIDLSIFSSLGEVALYETSTREEAKERIKDVDIIVMNKLNMDEDLLQHAKKVKLICFKATGTNNIDLNYTKKRNITVTNVKGYSTSNVVQVTFSLLFYLIGKLPYFDNYVKSGEYAVIFLTEEIAVGLEEQLAQYKDMPLPAVVSIPGQGGSTGYGISNLRSAVERAVGADILFRE